MYKLLILGAGKHKIYKILKTLVVGKTCLFNRIISISFGQTWPTVGTEFATLPIKLDGKIVKL